MRCKFIIPLFIAPFLTAITIPPIIDIPPVMTVIRTDFDVIGPCHLGSNNITLSGYYSSRVSYSNVRERLSVGVVGENYKYFETKSKHDLPTDVNQYLTFTLPLKDYLTNKGLSAKFELLDSNSVALYSFTFNLKPVSPTSMQPILYTNTPYVIEDIVVKPNNYAYKHTEEFLFDGFLDYFNKDNYYRIDLNDLYITYKAEKPFPICEGALHFTDFDRLFPYLDGVGKIPQFDIPVVAYQSGNQIRFKFKNTMYVKPKTLDMSLIPRDEFVPTNYFYLPINKRKQMMDQLFFLNMDKFGHGEISFNWIIRYITNRGLIGDCDTSDYCVIGEIE